MSALRRPHGWALVVTIVATCLVVGVVAVIVPVLHAFGRGRPPASVAVKMVGAKGLGLHYVKQQGMTSPPGPMAALSAVYHITPDGPLPRPVTIQFRLDRSVTQSGVRTVFVFTKELPGGRWKPHLAKVLDHGMYASLTVTRLSWFWVGQVDPNQVLQALKDFFNQLTGGTWKGATPPSCNQSSSAQSDGYTYATDGTAFLGCFGMSSDGGRIVKLVDARRYPLLITAHMPVKVGSGDIFEQLGRLLSPDGYVVYPQDEADLNATIPDPTSAVTTLFARGDFAPEGQLLSSLSVGVNALFTILDMFGPKTSLAKQLETLKQFLEVDSCAHSTNAGELITNCFTIKELTGAFGDVLGVLLAPIVTVSSLIDYFHGALNGIFDQFDGRSGFVAAVQRAPSPFAVLKNVDWMNMPIPGSWFDGPAQVQLHVDQYGEGIARNVPTTINAAQSNESEDVYLSAKPVYGYMGNVAVAAVRVDIQAAGSGTADGQRGSAYLVYKAGPNGPVYIGAATSQAAWPGAWAPDPTQADHTDLLVGASFQSGNLVIQDSFYGPDDSTAGPSGRATTSWSLSEDSLVAGQTVITQKASS